MAAPYQLPSDGVGGRPYSGVIKSDGTWVPCAADNEDWDEYVEWAGDYSKNHPDPYRSPADGGVAIKLAEGQVAVGAMLDSMPPDPPPASTPPPTTTAARATSTATKP